MNETSFSQNQIIYYMETIRKNKKLTKIGPYILLKPIGKGAYSVVYEAKKQREDTKFAIKKISLVNTNKKTLERLHIQLKVLSVIKHRNIVQLIDSKQTTRNLYLVFQHCKHTDLQAHIQKYYNGKLPEDQVKKIMLQIKKAFLVLREHKIVHRDLKLSNILVTDDFQIKIADFGFAKSLDDNEFFKSYVGTPLTMAPQILDKKQYNEKCDIWSLGIVIYQMLFGKNPFIHSNRMTLKQLRTALKGQLVFPFEISDEAKDLILKMLVRDVTKRCSFQQFFSHPWLADQSEDNINQILLQEALRVELNRNLIKNSRTLQEKNFIKQKCQQILSYTLIEFVKNNVQNQLMFWVNLGKKIMDMKYINEKLNFLAIAMIVDNINIAIQAELDVFVNSQRIFKFPKYMEMRSLQTWEMSQFTKRLPNFLNKSRSNFVQYLKIKKVQFESEDKKIAQLFLQEIVQDLKQNSQASLLKTFFKLKPIQGKKIEIKLQSSMLAEKTLRLLIKKANLQVENNQLLKKCIGVFKCTQIKRPCEIDTFYEVLKLKYS